MSSKSPFMSRRYKGLLAHQLIQIWNHHELGKGHTGITLQEVKCVHTYVRARKREPAGSVKKGLLKLFLQCPKFIGGFKELFFRLI